MKMQKIIRYTNMQTGETKEKINYVDMQFDDEEGYLFWNRKSHIKTFLDRPLPPVFTWAEKGRINELKNYILRDNQMLVYKSGSVLKPITTKEVCRILEMSDRQARALIKKMKLSGLLKEIKFDGSNYFVFSPIYGLKAKRISLTLYLIFQIELQKVLPEWVINNFLYQARELKPTIKLIK